MKSGASSYWPIYTSYVPGSSLTALRSVAAWATAECGDDQSRNATMARQTMILSMLDSRIRKSSTRIQEQSELDPQPNLSFSSRKHLVCRSERPQSWTERTIGTILDNRRVLTI